MQSLVWLMFPSATATAGCIKSQIQLRPLSGARGLLFFIQRNLKLNLVLGSPVQASTGSCSFVTVSLDVNEDHQKKPVRHHQTHAPNSPPTRFTSPGRKVRTACAARTLPELPWASPRVGGGGRRGGSEGGRGRWYLVVPSLRPHGYTHGMACLGTRGFHVCRGEGNSPAVLL